MSKRLTFVLIALMAVAAVAATSVVTGSFMDLRDGRVYKTTTIGSQTWMAENLDYEADYSRCYGGDYAACAREGQLYEWKSAMIACPAGWHLPSKSEFETLFEAVGGKSVAGKMLKSKHGWRDMSGKESAGNGTDAFSFSASPDIRRSWDANFWISEGDDSFIYYVSLSYYSDSVFINYAGSLPRISDSWYNVRCVKDESAEPFSFKKDKGFVKFIPDYIMPDYRNGHIKDFRDGLTYRTVTIGDQTWMAENLNYEADGSACYEDSTSNCDKYGRLYTWGAAKDACPSGWRLPKMKEFFTLFENVGGSSTAAKMLKSRTGWHWHVWESDHYVSTKPIRTRRKSIMTDGNGIDAFSFTALPESDRGENVCFWSSDGFDSESNFKYAMTIENMMDEASYNSFYTEDDFFGGPYWCAVRCFKEKPAKKTKEPSPVKVENAVKFKMDDFRLVTDYNVTDYRSGIMTDERDGQKYRTVVIGKQTWMAENLNYRTEGSYCYDDDELTCFQYGRLYKWEPATDACPAGWHLPSYKEILDLKIELSHEVYNDSVSADMLKSRTGWKSVVDSSGPMCKILLRCGSERKGTDLFGFSVLPTGFRVSDRLNSKAILNLLREIHYLHADEKYESEKHSDYRGEGEQALFWTSSEVFISRNKGGKVHLASFEYKYGGIGLEYGDKDNGYSVRCVKD